MRLFRTELLLAACLITVACSGGTFTGGDADGGPTAVPDGGGTPADAGPGLSCAGLDGGDLTGLFDRAFDGRQPTGCTAGCHGSGSGSFRFSDARGLHDATVDVPMTSGSGQRVVPGDPSASGLWQRLGPHAASRMPPGGPYLDEATLNDVAAWICAGAPPPAAVVNADAGADAGVVDAGTTDAGPAPHVTGFTPSSGLEGTLVTITGTDFAATVAEVKVDFAGLSAAVQSASLTQVEATVPLGALSGPLGVTVRGQRAQSATVFQVLHASPAPVLTSVSPAQVTVGAGDTTVSLAGSAFTASSTAKLDATALATIFVSDTALTALVPAAALAATKVGQLTVTTPAPGGGTSAPVSFTIANPAPTLVNLSPTSAAVGAAAQVLTVTGAGFTASSVILFDGVAATTTVASVSQLTTTLGAAALASAGTHQVAVRSPAPGGGTSSVLTFSVTNPAPTLSSISPATVASGGAAFTLTVTGSNFVGASVVNLDGAPVTTTFVSPTQLTAPMPAFSTVATHQVTVATPAPGGGTSSAATLTVQAVSGPFISSMSPSPAPAGQSFTLTLSGANFLCAGTGAQVLFNGATLSPSSCAATQLTVLVPSTAAGAATVQVQNPGNVLGNTVSLSLVVPNPVPTLAALSPSAAPAGSAALTLTVSGTGFVAGTQVTVAGSARATTFVSATQADDDALYRRPGDHGQPGHRRSESAPRRRHLQLADLLHHRAQPAAGAQRALSGVAPGGLGGHDLDGHGQRLRAHQRAHRQRHRAHHHLRVGDAGDDTALGGRPGQRGRLPVTVTSPAPGGGTSSALTFTVIAVNPLPVLASLSPSTVPVGSGATTLTLTGSGFVAGSQVTVGGAARTTTYVSATTLSAALPASDFASPVSLSVTVTSPAPGGGASNALTMKVGVNPVPTLSTLSPCGVVAGSGAFTLTLTGTGFLPGSTVTVGGTAVTVTPRQRDLADGGRASEPGADRAGLQRLGGGGDQPGARRRGLQRDHPRRGHQGLDSVGQRAAHLHRVVRDGDVPLDRGLPGQPRPDRGQGGRKSHRSPQRRVHEHAACDGVRAPAQPERVGGQAPGHRREPGLLGERDAQGVAAHRRGEAGHRRLGGHRREVEAGQRPQLSAPCTRSPSRQEPAAGA